MPSEIWDVGMRLRDMDANGVDVQVLSPTVFTFFYHQDPALALACAAIQNEEIAAVIKRQPDRFIGLGSVPLQAPEQAAAELRRVDDAAWPARRHDRHQRERPQSRRSRRSSRSGPRRKSSAPSSSSIRTAAASASGSAPTT